MRARMASSPGKATKANLRLIAAWDTYDLNKDGKVDARGTHQGAGRAAGGRWCCSRAGSGCTGPRPRLRRPAPAGAAR